MMFKDHSISGATKERNRKIMSLNRMKEREEMKRCRLEMIMRKQDMTKFFFNNYKGNIPSNIEVTCSEREIEIYTEKQLEVLLNKRYLKQMHRNAATTIQKNTRMMIFRKNFLMLVSYISINLFKLKARNKAGDIL
jgi:hypothetical protein